jgi:branched-chain amino acid transport system permease protein
MVAASTIAEIIINGLQQGAIFALLGIGLTIILGTMNFLNLAHGALYLVGAYVAMLLFRETQLNSGLLAENGVATVGVDGGFLLALVFVPVIGLVVGAVMERYVANPFYDRPETDQLLVTFGLALIIEELIRRTFGGATFQAITPGEVLGVSVSGSVNLPVVGSYSVWRLWLIGITLGVIGITYLIIEKTDFGLVVRAGTQDSEMVRLMGIRITRSYSLVFALGAALAAFAGFMSVTFQNINPQIGTQRALIPAFLTIVVGGAGNVLGAIVGGFVLGITLAAMTAVAAQWSRIVLFGVAALVLLVRPEGLLGSAVEH